MTSSHFRSCGVSGKKKETCSYRRLHCPSQGQLQMLTHQKPFGDEFIFLAQVILLMNGMSLMEMLLNLIFYALDTEVVMDDMIDSILKLGLCGCYILVQVEKATCCSHFASTPHFCISAEDTKKLRQ